MTDLVIARSEFRPIFSAIRKRSLPIVVVFIPPISIFVLIPIVVVVSWTGRQFRLYFDIASSDFDFFFDCLEIAFEISVGFNDFSVAFDGRIGFLGTLVSFGSGFGVRRRSRILNPLAIFVLMPTFLGRIFVIPFTIFVLKNSISVCQKQKTFEFVCRHEFVLVLNVTQQENYLSFVYKKWKNLLKLQN